MNALKSLFEWNEKNKRVYLANIVYVFLSILYCRSIWAEQDIKIMDFICIVTYLVLPLMFVLIFGVAIPSLEKVQYENIYCRKRDVTFNKIRQWPLLPSWKLGIYITLSVIGITIVYIYGNTIFDFLNVVVEKHSLKLENIKAILEIYALMVALIPIAYTYVERRYMLFDFENLPSVRWFEILLPTSIIILLLAVICNSICEENTWSNNVSTMSWILWWGIVTVAVLKLILIILPRQNLEKKALKLLDKAFWNEKLYVIPNKSWYRSAVIIAITELFIKYLKVVSKRLTTRCLEK